MFVTITAFILYAKARKLIQLLSHTQGGLYIFQVFDYYACSGMTLLLIAILQSVGVGWVYGKFMNYRNIKASS